MQSFLKRMALVAVFVSPSLSMIGQSTPESAVSLTIRFAGGVSEFHVGEKVPIEMAFTSSVPKTFELNPRTYDRSGRLDLEAFHVAPEGRDPLRNYFQGGLFGGGGMSSMPQYLSSEPQTVTEELNEWVAIDEPGHYSLYVISTRVGRGGQSFTNPITIQSNTLEFDVVDADTAWQQQMLITALAVLNDPSSTREEKDTALRTLRFLDSPASIHELARCMTDPGQEYRWECKSGLIGSHHQKLVVQELESLMAAQEAAIRSDFLELLAETKFMLDRGPMPVPSNGETEQEAYTERVNARQQEFEALQTSLYSKAASFLSVKTGAARAVTIQTLLMAAPSGDGKTKPSIRVSDSDIESALLGLPADGQYSLLKYFWPQIRHPMMVGVLEKILDQQTRDQDLQAVALVRLNEMDHEKAAARVLEEIQHPTDNSTLLGRQVLAVLSILPDKLMPQFDNMLATRLEEKNSPSLSLDSQLIARYATKSILPRVKAVYQNSRGDASCEVSDSLISYFLRVDAEFGIRQIKDASLYCNRRSLETVVRMRRWSTVEPGLIAQLNGPDLTKARNAAEVLGEFGGPAAKRVMLERLRSFHKQWAKREAEFRSTPDTPKAIGEASSFQFGLLQAMATAQGWILDDAEFTEIEQLAIGQGKENVSSWHPPGSEKTAVDINLIDLDDFTVTVDRYTVHNLDALRAKLAQFPSGTRFVLLDFQLDRDKRTEPVMQAVREVAQEHGFNLEITGNQ